MYILEYTSMCTMIFSLAINSEQEAHSKLDSDTKFFNS